MIFQIPTPPSADQGAELTAPIASVRGELLPLVSYSSKLEPDLPPADWVRPPTLTELRSVYPSDAAADGVSGQTKLFCTVDSDGVLSSCQGDLLPSYPFYEAALSLTPALRIKRNPAFSADAIGKVLITIRFIIQNQASSVSPVWMQSPTEADVKAVFPKSVSKLIPESGTGFMRCVADKGLLTACEAADDRRSVFTQAALKLAPHFLLAAELSNGKPSQNVILTVPVAFNGPGTAPTLPSSEKPIQFVREATAAQKNAAFPVDARARGITNLLVTERCIVALDGSLNNCKALREEPTGVGGAEAANRLANTFQVSTWDTNGRPVTGRSVTFQVSWGPAPTGDLQPPEKTLPAVRATTPDRRDRTRPTGKTTRN